MLDVAILRCSTSNYASSEFLKLKKDGNHRFLCNFAKLNEKIEQDRNSVPRIENIFQAMEGANYFSKLDANQGFFQIPLAEESKKITAIIVDNELYEFNVLPQGLKTSPAAFSKVMAQNFADNMYHDVVVYMDDICTYSKGFDAGLEALEKTFKTLRRINLKLKTAKCEFLEEEIQLLGHKISKDGIKTLEKNIEAIRSFPRPRTKKQVRSFLGSCGYYRKFIKNFSKLCVHLTNLTKGDPDDKSPVQWTEECQKEFEQLKKAMTTPPVLALFREGRETRVELDASAIAVGGVLSQKDEQTGKWHPIAYYSQKMPPKFQNEVAYDLELQGLVKTLNHFREYLYGGPKFDVFTDHLSLTHIAKSKQQPSRRLARMVSKLADYDFNIRYKKGRLNIVPDCLSRVEIEEKSEENEKIESKINKIKNKKLLKDKSDSESSTDYSEQDSMDSELEFESDSELTSSYESLDDESAKSFIESESSENRKSSGK